MNLDDLTALAQAQAEQLERLEAFAIATAEAHSVCITALMAAVDGRYAPTIQQMVQTLASSAQDRLPPAALGFFAAQIRPALDMLKAKGG